MANIFAFLAKYHKFFLFLLLELVSFSFLIRYNKNQKVVVEGWSHELSGRVNKSYDDLNYYFKLKQVNDSLIKENTRLHHKLESSIYRDTAKTRKASDTIYYQKYKYVPARVVNNSVSFRSNFLTLDIGKNKKVKKQQGVITTSGIVGVTRSVSNHFTAVLSVLHKDFTVSAEIAETGEIGSIVWEGDDARYVMLKDIPAHARIKRGQHVVTSPYSAIFPQGTTIGKIVKYELKPGDAFYTIYVKLATDMRNVRQVYVIKNLMKTEQESIEPTPEELND